MKTSCLPVLITSGHEANDLLLRGGSGAVWLVLEQSGSDRHRLQPGTIQWFVPNRDTSGRLLSPNNLQVYLRTALSPSCPLQVGLRCWSGACTLLLDSAETWTAGHTGPSGPGLRPCWVQSSRTHLVLLWSS